MIYTDKHTKFLQRAEYLALSTLSVKHSLSAALEHHDGAMVALVPDDPYLLAINDKNALPADDLHATLCYLGKAQDLSDSDKLKIVSVVRKVCYEVGSVFSTNSDGVVIMGSNDEGVPATALLVQSDEIVNLYNVMSEALHFEPKYPSFIPHITLGHDIPVEDAEEHVGQPISFSNVIIKFGDEVHTVPLASTLTAASPGANVIEQVIDSLGRRWDEGLHPRDDGGKFIKKDGAVSGKLAVPKPSGGVEMVDANRAKVVGFRTFDNDVWVQAEITNPDGSTTRGFSRASQVKAAAPVKARLDALYPVDETDGTVDLPLERKRQLDLILAYINAEFGPSNDVSGNTAFLESLGLREADLEYLHGEDPDFLDGLRKMSRNLSQDELDEQQEIIEDARSIKKLRDRVNNLQE